MDRGASTSTAQSGPAASDHLENGPSEIGPASNGTAAISRGLRWAIGWAVLLRVVVGVHLFAFDPLTRELVSDAAYYDAWARASATGATWDAGLPYWMPPLYPWLLGALYQVTGGALAVTLLLQACIGIANTLLFVALAKRLLEPRAVLLAAWAWVLYAPLVLFEQRLLAVNAALPLVLGGLLLTMGVLDARARGDTSRVPAFAAGLCFGLACLARPNLLFGPLGLLVGGWFDLARLRRDAQGDVDARTARRGDLAAVALAVLGAVLPLAFSAQANASRSGERVLVSANGGVNFHFGNNAGAAGTFRAPDVAWGDIFEQRDVATRRAAAALGVAPDTLDAGAVNDHWFAQGRTYLLDHPGDAAALWARKFTANLSSHEYGIQVVLAAVREGAPSLWLAPLPFGLVLALAVYSRGRGVRYRFALLGWIVAATVAALLYFTYSRFRLPWYPALVPFAAAGAASLFARDASARRPRAIAALVALGVLAFSYWPSEGAYGRGLRANACVDTALAWERRGAASGEVELAAERRRRWLERALEIAPTDAKALDELARLAWSQGVEREALDLLTRALATPVDYPPARRRLALLRFEAQDPNVRDPRAGREVLETWLAAHPPQTWGALELGLALGDHLLSSSTFDPDARTRLFEVIAWLERAHADDPRLVDLAQRAGR